MMMYRPWRDLEETVAHWARRAWDTKQCDDIWDALFAEFLHWRDTLLTEAAPYYDAALSTPPTPQYNTLEWWTCLTYPKVLNMELALGRKRSSQYSSPQSIDGIPVEADPDDKYDDTASDPSSGDSDEDPPQNADRDSPAEQPSAAPSVRSHYPSVPGRRCPDVLHRHRLHAVLGVPCNLGRRSAESKYSEEFLARTRAAMCSMESVDEHDAFVMPDEEQSAAWTHWSVGAVQHTASVQSGFFKTLDAGEDSAESLFEKMQSDMLNKVGHDPFNEVRKRIRTAIVEMNAETRYRGPSHSIVLEAAVFLLQRGLLNVKGKTYVNVKQARALLVFASWLQFRKSMRWADEKKLQLHDAPSTVPRTSNDEFFFRFFFKLESETNWWT